MAVNIHILARQQQCPSLLSLFGILILVGIMPWNSHSFTLSSSWMSIPPYVSRNNYRSFQQQQLLSTATLSCLYSSMKNEDNVDEMVSSTSTASPTGTTAATTTTAAAVATTISTPTTTTTTFIDSTNLAPSPGVPENTIIRPLTFRGHDVYTQVTNLPTEDTIVTTTTTTTSSKNDLKPIHVILLHGFGCSTVYWRETIHALTTTNTMMETTKNRQYIVHALDLLGQGKSAKPGTTDGIQYSINLWAELVDAYAQEYIRPKTNDDNDNNDDDDEEYDIVLVGNSFGSTVALSVATGDYYYDNDTDTCSESSQKPWICKHIKGICMFNCGIGMNSMNIVKEAQWTPVQRFLLKFVFTTMNKLIFSNIPVLTYILGKVVTKDVLQSTLISLYQHSEAPLTAENRVNQELVDSFYYPAKDVGSVDVLSQIYTNDPGKTPMELFEDERYATSIFSKVPIHLIWGDDDPITPIEGGLGVYYTKLAAAAVRNGDEISATNISSRSPIPKITLEMVHAGHIPFDEAPKACHGSMHKWLDRIFA